MGFFNSLLKLKSDFPTNVNSFLDKLEIPEPTRSLLWITDEGLSKIIKPLEYRININVDSDNRRVDFEFLQSEGNFYAEPSLIWTKLSIKKNNLEQHLKMYYPSYSTLTPEQRWKYLMWLKDISQDVDLSYKFIYFYGLERQLLVGNFENAVTELAKLYKNDRTTSYDFKGAIIHSLILASGHKKRTDIFKLAPFVMNALTNESLVLRAMGSNQLRVEEVLSLFLDKRVGGNYLVINFYKKNSKLFERVLKEVYSEYVRQYGELLDLFDISTFPRINSPSYYNFSFPREIRTAKFPQLLYNKKFKSVISDLISETYRKCKKY